MSFFTKFSWLKWEFYAFFIHIGKLSKFQTTFHHISMHSMFTTTRGAYFVPETLREPLQSVPFTLLQEHASEPVPTLAGKNKCCSILIIFVDASVRDWNVSVFPCQWLVFVPRATFFVFAFSESPGFITIIESLMSTSRLWTHSGVPAGHARPPSGHEKCHMEKRKREERRGEELKHQKLCMTHWL